MIANKQTIYKKDAANKKLTVEREFAASPERIWDAWTNPEILDQWWAPKPWKAKTKSMDFREGGTWLYSMLGPEGEETFCKAEFKVITPITSYSIADIFCDEKGIENSDMPKMNWKCDFSKSENGTKVYMEITFPSEADMQKIIDMGFQQGFEAAHGNLDELLA